jgi:hypothetical protein
MLRLVPVCSALLVLGALVGCESEPALGPPAGWAAEGDRWWQEGVDTSIAFRDLETFAAMGLGDGPEGKRPEGPAHRNVQQQFLPLYRNAPETVDSLFAAIAVPLVDERAQEDDRDALVRDINRAFNRVFFYPRPAPDQTVTIPYPDSLRSAGVGGDVKMQVYLSEEGAPLAIKLVDGVHPTLDQIALHATARKRWIPATVQGRPMRSYVRSVLGFNAPQ